MAEANSINAATTGIVGNTGTAFTGTAVTAHNVIVGGSTPSTLSNVAPSVASGVPFISQGVASDPAFGTAVVAGGGTGDTSFTAYAVICGGTASTNPLQSIAGVGTSPQVLTSNGAGALPTFQSVSASGAITTITGNSGGAEVPSAGNFNIVGTGSITVAGSANTETVQLTGLTNHNVLLGAGTATITVVAPSATSGIPLVSNGASADPSFTTAVVAGGGTGATSFNINGPVISSTTTTGALAAITLANQQFLVGNTSAAPTAKSLSVVTQVFTTPGANTYTPTSGMVYCIIEVTGGGGGGGGAQTSGGGTAAAGGGGGGGGYARISASAATIGASQTATVGAAGAAGAAGPNNGGTGGTSSLGAIVSATGGTGGQGSNAAGLTSVSGGSGGTGSGGSFNTTGAPGDAGFSIGTLGLAMPGFGGSTFFGGGAVAVLQTSAGNAATSYGGGGGGGGTVNAGQTAGGAGFAGIVVITEFVIA